MKARFKQILARSPWLQSLAARLYRNLRSPGAWRGVWLSGKRLPAARLAEAIDNPAYCNVIADLCDYTGFSLAELKPYVLRYPRQHFESEFNWFAPQTQRELTWFYRCSSAYLFANALHTFEPNLQFLVDVWGRQAIEEDQFRSRRVLDYGAGIGCNTIALAHLAKAANFAELSLDLHIDFLEISRMQADFLKFRAMKQNFSQIHEVLPYVFTENMGDRDQGISAPCFDPIGCITEQYDAIIAIDVLEHIPNYPDVVRQFLKHLKPGGFLLEQSPFEASAADIAIHVPETIPLVDLLQEMTQIQPGIWQKP